MDISVFEGNQDFIIDFREDHGPFTSIEEILGVTGIGPATFDGIKELITVGNSP